MTDFTALYRELDPLRPLEADETALYVDWQKLLDPDVQDAKTRLAREFARNATPDHTIIRLLTGHKGSGKTTELNRVAGALRSGAHGKRVFVSTLFAARWLDLEDVEAEDVELQVVRQLAADLDAAGVSVARSKFKASLGSLFDRFKGFGLSGVDVGADPLTFSFALKDFPSRRREFRDALKGQLPTVFDMVNRELLPEARQALRMQGYDDILLVIDDLDKIEQKVIGDGSVTNHETLFLQNAGTLRALACSQILTVPIELAYSLTKESLRGLYGSDIFTVPVVTVTHQDGTKAVAGRAALVEIVGRRVRRATHATVDAHEAALALFASPDDLDHAIEQSGGHVRGLLVMLTELLGYVDDLPVDTATIDRYLRQRTREVSRGLRDRDRDILRTVAETGRDVDDPRFWDLLRHQYVFAYEAGDEDYWYGINPLVARVIE